MTMSNEIPTSTTNTRLPFGTIIATTIALLFPPAVIAVLLWERPSTTSAIEPFGVQKLRELQAAEKRQLTTYEWIEPPTADKPGMVRLPISRARELMLKEKAVPQKVSK